MIDQNIHVSETLQVAPLKDKSNSEETVKVRSFEEIIKEKRARQRKERELAQHFEKESSTNEITPLSVTNDLIKRKPVIRRQVPAMVDFSAVSKKTTTELTIHDKVSAPNNEDSSQLNKNESLHSDSNMAKVSPLNIIPLEPIECDNKTATVLNHNAQTEQETAKRLQSSALRRVSVTISSLEICNGIDKQITRTNRKRSITSSNEQNLRNIKLPSNVDDIYLETSKEAKFETQLTSRKDIQEALDENRRKREQDLLSDEEFEKEINKLGSDDDDDNFDDMNEDDLMMELEQMIDS